jgi:ABC-type bacteriocin/lantibiotic exporter with double-glycine peptidase domain
MLKSFCSYFSLFVPVFWTNRFSEYHRPFIRENIKNWDEQRKVRTEAFQHLGLIKVFGVEQAYLIEYLRGRIDIVKYSYNTWIKSVLHQHRRRLFFNVSRIISIFVIIYQSYLGQMLVGNIYAVWTWLNDIFSNIRTLTQALRNIPLRFVELEKYLDIIDKNLEFANKNLKEEIKNLNERIERIYNNIQKLDQKRIR